MSKQFTIITKDGSKWLRAVNPFDENGQAWRGFQSSNPDIPYLGSHPEGTVLSEEQVRGVKQTHHKDEDSDYWYTSPSQAHTEFAEQRPDYTVRTAYTDAESHTLPAFDEILNNTSDDAKMNVSLQMDLNYWKRRCEAAEKYINESPCDPDITPAQEAAYDAWQEIVKQQPK